MPESKIHWMLAFLEPKTSSLRSITGYKIPWMETKHASKTSFSLTKLDALISLFVSSWYFMLADPVNLFFAGSENQRLDGRPFFCATSFLQGFWLMLTSGVAMIFE
jgi:hypothetical protein